jgi:hypothetical protein
MQCQLARAVAAMKQRQPSPSIILCRRQAGERKTDGVEAVQIHGKLSRKL